MWTRLGISGILYKTITLFIKKKEGGHYNPPIFSPFVTGPNPSIGGKYGGIFGGEMGFSFLNPL